MTKPSRQSEPPRYMGRSVPRREDQRLVTGAGCFTDDVTIPDALQIHFVRSMQAAGNLRGLDNIDKARAAPGVVAVFTGADVAGLGKLAVNAMLQESHATDYPILARDRVQAVGQPIAAIVADTVQNACDAAEITSAQIDELPPSIQATDANAPLINAHIAGNAAMASNYVANDASMAFAAAEHVVQAQIKHPRLAPAAMETRSVAVQFDAKSGNLTIWLSTQTPHRARQQLANITGIDIDRLRVIAPDVGGAFGMKASLYPEEVLVVWAAHRLGRSVRWAASRNEDMLAATHGRGAVTCGSLAVDAQGRFTALRATVVCPLGYWLPTSAGVPAWNAARILPGPYAIDMIDITSRAVLTNTSAVGIYRGAGRPEAATLMERLVDAAARQTGLDPVQIRLKNFVEPAQMPHTGPTGNTLDSGHYEQAVNQLLEQSDYANLRARQRQRRAAGECVGIGLAAFVEPCGQGWESASIRIGEDGRVLAMTGGSTQGHGRETAFAQIVADTLKVPIDTITVCSGDTDVCPSGIGALASRSTAIGGSAMLRAARQLRVKLEQDPDQQRPVHAEVVYEADGEAWGYGCYLAVVSVDTQTGQVNPETLFCVDDTGTVINPALAHGQVIGGIAQGLGEALMEQLIYDDDGQLLTGSLMDYALPRAADMPQIRVGTLCTATTNNLLGAKGVGEAGTIGTPVAILNAVNDALAPLGFDGPLSMPLTSEQVWRAIESTRNK